MNSAPDPINIYMNFEIPLKSGLEWSGWISDITFSIILFQNENRKRNALGIEMLHFSEPLSADVALTSESGLHTFINHFTIFVLFYFILL